MISSLSEASGSSKKLVAVDNTSNKDAIELKATIKTEIANNETKQSAEVDKASLESAVDKLNDFIAPAAQSIKFELDQSTDRVVVKVVDEASQKVLRQIPSEQVLSMAKTLDKLKGLVIKQTA